MTVKRARLLLFYFLFWTVIGAVEFVHAVDEIIGYRNGKIVLKAHDAAQAGLVKAFHEQYSVEIKGLQSKENEKISFSFEADSLEDLLKGLLRHLGIRNYAIEFAVKS